MTEVAVISDEVKSLIALLDDESEGVRFTVRQQLAAKERELRVLLESDDSDAEDDGGALSLTPTQKRIISAILQAHSLRWFQTHWAHWRRAEGGPAQLEEGLSCISDFLGDGERGTGRLTDLLDDLADECRDKGADADPAALIEYLFKKKEYRGNEEDYYDPCNCDLARVIREKRGNYVSLTTLFLLVGWRLGLKIGGCDYPGRLLARFDNGKDIWLVDCMRGGELIGGSEVIARQPLAHDQVRELIERPATAKIILVRVLEELETAFARSGLPQEAEVTRKLLREMTV